jgi:hypothetical protein
MMNTGLIETPSLSLHGKIVADCYEIGGVDPIMIIRSDQEWEVRVKWKMDGSVVPMIDDRLRWHLHVTIESMGPGPEKSIVIADVPWGATPEWEEVERFKEDFIEGLYRADGDPPPHEGGLFKIFVLLTLRNERGIPLPVAGNVELGNIHWYPVPE